MKNKLVWDNLTYPEETQSDAILSDLLDAIYVHDYSYMMSDDERHFDRGRRHEVKIKSMIDIMIMLREYKPLDLLKQSLDTRAEQYVDGLTHKIIKQWYAPYF
jgi:hypothetical protein